MTPAVFPCSIASTRDTAFIGAAETAFGVSVVVVVGCPRVLGCHGRVGVSRSAGKSFLRAGV